MAHVTQPVKLRMTVRQHVITREGRHVLYQAAPQDSWLTRKRAAHNKRRWDEGKRTWLL